MDIWSVYADRASAHGTTRRETAHIRETRMINDKLPHNLSYQLLSIDDVEQNVAIINSDNLNEKYIYSMPGERIRHGGLVHWMDNYWLVTELDANNTVYSRGKLTQCNHLLKWMGKNGEINEQWCIVEDGTKYLTGEYEDRHFIVTRGDSRIAVTIARNEKTVNFSRENRFLIDDKDSDIKMAYQLTKPLKLGWTYGEDGIYKFVLQEVQATEDDNHKLGIADFFKYYPKSVVVDAERANEINTDTVCEETGRRVWL